MIKMVIDHDGRRLRAALARRARRPVAPITSLELRDGGVRSLVAATQLFRSIRGSVSAQPGQHLLKELLFPARYEALASRLGPQLAAVLVAPEPETMELFEDAAQGLRNRGEGLFLPMHAPSGTGKTTLANNLDRFLPNAFTSTITVTGDVTTESLLSATKKHLEEYPLGQKIVPINIDHREGSPPNEHELSSIKRFLRMPGTGDRSLIVWPETSDPLAQSMTASYRSIAGKPPVNLPLSITGPPKITWPTIAKDTLRLANGLDSLDSIGVDPDDYEPADYRSIGDFLREISDDFTRLTTSLQRSTRKALRLVVVFVSESSDAGVLTHLTSSSRFGLLDGGALLDASPQSEVGRWWSSRRGLLTSTIVRLDARVFGLPPSASVGIVRRFGPEGLKKVLEDVEIRTIAEDRIARNLERCDIGKYLIGKTRTTFETKGTPTTTSLAAFQLMAEQGFNSGHDKSLNRAMAEGLAAFGRQRDMEFSTAAETKLEFCPLIPDNSLNFSDEAICFEYTWRKGDFLTNKNRGNIAQYCLTKLRNYSRELGWSPE